MSTKKWMLVLLCLLLIFGWYKLFYKTYTETAVPKSADCIIALDTKRIINTFIWNIITTPAQWKFSTSAKPEAGISLDDIVKLPDYIFIFHVSGQPVNAWYTMLEIKNGKDFIAGLQQYHFEKKDALLFSKELGISLIQNGQQLLVTNLTPENDALIRQTADELFSKHLYTSKNFMKVNIKALSHVSVQSQKQSLLGDEYLISANFDKNAITVRTVLPAKFNANYAVKTFQYNDSSLCVLAFTQPYFSDNTLLPDSSRAKISKVLNFDIDSMFLPSNTCYQLDIEGFHSRSDSAVTYSYDDNFNAVEKATVNIIEEPAFNFIIEGKDINPIYSYWKRSGKLEPTAAGELFTCIPFVKSYCSIQNKDRLSITSDNYKPAPAKHSVDCILFFRMLIARIPASLIKYLPGEFLNLAKNIEAAEAVINNEKEQRVLSIKLIKKKNDLPVIEW